MPRSGGKIRRDSKHRILRPGESVRSDGKYQFKYQMNGKAHFFYSWRLEANDPLPAGKMPCLSLRELEKQITIVYGYLERMRETLNTMLENKMT